MTTGTFEFEGRVFPYLDAEYNGTRQNERAVEVPIALFLLGQSMGFKTLEVGAVLPHYLPKGISHLAIDLNEQFEGVVNADVLTWNPETEFDTIISVSTLDHLKSRGEVLTAVNRMKSWLKIGGLFFITLPWGQPEEVGGGPWLDEMILGNELGIEMVLRMDKVDPKRNIWEQVSLSEQRRSYHGPSPFANTVYLLFHGNFDGWWREYGYGVLS